MTIDVMSEQTVSARAVSRPNLRPTLFLIQKVSEFPLKSSGRSLKMSEDIPIPEIHLDNCTLFTQLVIEGTISTYVRILEIYVTCAHAEGWMSEMMTWLTDLLQDNLTGSK
jgi:hypothetical protein